MFKKTKVRSILELLGKNLSAREVSKVLGVSRNTVAEVQALFLQSDKSWNDISEKDAKNLYELFEQRSGNNSTIFVGQYPVDEWHNRLGGGT